MNANANANANANVNVNANANANDNVPPPIPVDPAGAFLWTLTHIVGFDTQAKRERVTNQGGVTTVMDLLMVDMTQLLDCLTATTSVMAKTKLQALKAWAEEKYDTEEEVFVQDFTADICREYQFKFARTKSRTQTKTDTTATTTSKDKLRTFNGKPENWLNAKRELTAYLNQIANPDGIPLYYVIRDPDKEQEYRESNGEVGGRIYDAPFRGRTYEQDAFKVLQVLRMWTSGGSAETYVDNNNNVQDAWSQLLTSYEGLDARNSNIQRARMTILKSSWSHNTHTYTFDDYCNKHIKANNELDRYGANVDQASQVVAFLAGIKANERDPTTKTIKVSIALDPVKSRNLRDAISAFKDALRTISNDERDKRQVNSTYRDRGGRGRDGRGHHGGRGGRGGRGRGNRDGYHGRGGKAGRGGTKSGIGIPGHVIASLEPKYQAMLFKGRAQMEIEQDNVHPSRQKDNQSSITSDSRKANRVETLNDNEEPDPNQDDENTGASSKFGATGRNNKKSKINKVVSTDRRVGKQQVTIQAPTDYSFRGRAEIDTRADTICAGSTFILYESTGKVVDVSGFHDTFEPLRGIQVGTCVTAIDLQGETIIASFPQSLYFGDSMEHSLIPPVQSWSYGITVDVVPKQFSDGRSLHGIHHPEEDIFIPFALHGCISYFPTRLPTPNEIDNCRWVTFTSDAEWQPYSDHFAESERATINHYRYPDPLHLHFNHDGDQLDGRLIKLATTTIPNDTDDLIDPMFNSFDHALHRSIHATSSTEHRTKYPIEVLAKRWGTTTHTAQATVDHTVQRGLRYLEGPLTRRFRTRQKQLEVRYLRTKMYTDTMFYDSPSARGNTCMQIFVTSEGFVSGDAMKSKSEAYLALDRVCRDYGVPKLLVSDNAKEETLGNWDRVAKEYLIKQRTTEPHSGWQNRCEDEIREIRKHFARIMSIHQCPDAFWDFALEHTLTLRRFLVRNAADQRPPIETILGDTPDISEIMDFDFYQWVKYRDPNDRNNPIKLGRWLGIARTVGSPLTYWILKKNGKVIPRSTVRPLLPNELNDETEKTLRHDFTQSVGTIYKEYDPDTLQVFALDELTEPHTTPITNDGGGDRNNDNDNEQNERDIDNEQNDRNENDNGHNDNENDILRGPDLFQNAEIFLPHKDRLEIAKVIGRKRNADGNYVGRAHKQPTLDSRVFTVRFPDGEEKDIAYNILAEHLFSQVDSEGNQYRLFKGIINHRRNKTALDKVDQYRIDSNGKRTKKKTTAGWDFEIEWKDGSTSWVPLRELKETNAVELAQYAQSNRIIEEPAFDWWAPHVLKKAKRLIKLSKSRQVRVGYKFGIRIPTSVAEALELDKANNNTLWYDAIMKEMTNVRIAFQEVSETGKPPPGYKFVGLMMIFDIKMDFTRKARLVARGDMTAPPSTLTYSSVVSRESVRIAFLIAALNDLDVLMFDVGNAYLNAPTTEKLYTIAGKEFGPDDEGKIMIIVRALYGLKSSGAAYRAHFATTLIELGFKSCLADPDVWFRPAMKPNGFQYYEYILTYVDDCLIVSHNTNLITEQLTNEYGYRLKDVGPPTRYLGAQIGRYRFEDGAHAWYMSAQLYLQQAISEIESLWGPLNKLFTDRQVLDVPLPPGIHPEVDDTPFLDDNDTQLYQSYVGVLRWAVELGRIDITHAAGVMARFSAAPRQGHMYCVLRILAYCKKHIESKIVFDPQEKDFDDIEFANADWKMFYPDIDGEVLPLNRPKPLGNPVQINMFCDAAHATCHLTRRSTTGIILFINGAPISWYSKRQNTIESSVFGSEFVALKIATEMNEALRYKLRMMGIPIRGPTNTFCDNKSVVVNTTVPQSTLQKKHNAVAYHKVRESVASESQRISHEPGKYNLSDCLTKFAKPPDFKRCVQCILMR